MPHTRQVFVAHVSASKTIGTERYGLTTVYDAAVQHS